MDRKSLDGATAKPPRKMKFAPKAPPKREQKLVLPKTEKSEIDRDDAKAEHLLHRLNETSSIGKEKVEKKAAPVQVAFGFKGSSNSNRSYSSHKGINGNQGSSSNGGAEQGVEKEYKEPWDYYTNYPITLPMRRPYSGNPELLDEEEFGHPVKFDENEINSVEELGLLDDDTENNMIFFQFPPSLPSIIQSANSEVPDPANNGKAATGSGTSQQLCNLESLPEGLMGKMLVYKSGAVKLKLGDTVFDVSAGVTTTMAQDVFVIDKEHKQCCNLGELNKCAVVTPDIDSILDDFDDL